MKLSSTRHILVKLLGEDREQNPARHRLRYAFSPSVVQIFFTYSLPRSGLLRLPLLSVVAHSLTCGCLTRERPERHTIFYSVRHSPRRAGKCMRKMQVTESSGSYDHKRYHEL